MGTRRIVVWLTEDTWEATVDAAAAMAGDAEVVLLHVVDSEVAEAAHGAFGGLLGRGSRQHDPGDAIAQLAQQDSAKLLGDAQRRLGRPVRMETRSGRVEREVVAAVARTDLLVCARNGDQHQLGPHSLGHHTRFIVDHTPSAVLLIWPGAAPALDSIPLPPHPRQPEH